MLFRQKPITEFCVYTRARPVKVKVHYTALSILCVYSRDGWMGGRTIDVKVSGDGQTGDSI